MPADQRPDPGSLLPRIGATMGMSAEQVDDLVASAPPPQPGAADAPGRIAWMDRIGIDYSFVNPGGALRRIGGVVEPVLRRPGSPPPRDGPLQRLPRRQLRAVHQPRLAGHHPRLRRSRLVDRGDGADAGPRQPRVLRVGHAVRGPFTGASRRRPVLACVHRSRNGRGAAHRQHARPLRGRLGRRGLGRARRRRNGRAPAVREQSAHRSRADVSRRTAVRRHVHAESRRDGRARRAVGELVAVVRVTARDARRRERSVGGVAARAVTRARWPAST